MTLIEFNNQSLEKVRAELFKCCGCTNWLNKLIKHFPFQSIEDLKINSDKAWYACSKQDWLEAFSHHPKIGEKAGENKNLTSTKEWASQEQSGVKSAAQSVLDELSLQNRKYEERFGYIYIVCATGKTAREMLEIVKERLNNDPEKELHIAAGEQNKITHLRIDKIFA
jgi:2-oxo-4-hydroxy-4-carboxy-5-ureidoimidazoline decarboxylase